VSQVTQKLQTIKEDFIGFHNDEYTQVMSLIDALLLAREIYLNEVLVEGVAVEDDYDVHNFDNALLTILNGGTTK
jgi:hypothetical protein